MRDLSDELVAENSILSDLNEKIAEQEAIKSELLSTKIKLARAASASSILSGVSFEFCPACGTEINNPPYSDEDLCRLCGKHPEPPEFLSLTQDEVDRFDLDSRIYELDESIRRHRVAREQQEWTIATIREEKSQLDERLAQELEEYDSIFLARTRELERRIATFQERTVNLERIARLPEAVSREEQEASDLAVEQAQLERQIQEEKNSLKSADQYIQEIEETFFHALLSVGVPGVRQNDQIEINRQTWIPSLIKGNNPDIQENFYNAGSGGKKTMWTICYALAVHEVAARNHLPLPTFLIIDSPMKNISEDVNQELFESFYEQLYSLANSTLSNTQIIIVEQKFVPPQQDGIDIIQRYMTPNDDKHPPLISYYRET